MASCHEVLCAIAKADLASADRKAAVRRAVEVALLGAVALDRGGTDAGEQKQDVHDYYEHVLTGISRLAGRTKTMKVEEAKTWIRGHEDAEALKLATRLGKLSQRRNGRIHQDWLLLEAVAEMVTKAPEAPNTGGQTTGAGELAREGTAGQTRQLRRAGSEPEKEPTMHAQGGDAIIEPRQLKVQLSDASTATSVDPADEPAVGNCLHRSTGVQATVAKRRSRGVQTAGKGSAPEDECSQVRAARGAGAPEDECSQVRAARGVGAPEAVWELPPTGMSCGKAMVRCPTLPPSEIFFYGDTLVETGCQTDSADVAGGVKQDERAADKKADQDVVLAAVSNYGNTLDYAADALKANRDAVLADGSKVGLATAAGSDEDDIDRITEAIMIVLDWIQDNPKAREAFQKELQERDSCSNTSRQ